MNIVSLELEAGEIQTQSNAGPKHAQKERQPSDRGKCYRGDPTTESVPSYLPCPEEIAEMCRQFQAGWSEQERLKRAGKSSGRPDAVEIHEARVGH